MENLKEWKKVGVMGAEVLAYAKKITKPETPLIEITKKVEEYVKKKKVAFAFPLNISMGEVAAHYSPIEGDDLKAEGLIKLDVGVMENGFLSDNACSVDLTPENKFKDLIKASEEGLKAGINSMKSGVQVRDVGRSIHEAILKRGFNPIKNLSGHMMERWALHAGANIPNYDNKDSEEIFEGIYAVEPFATNGTGLVKEGKPSNIYILARDRPVRLGREILNFIKEEYKTLAFSSKWITDRFGKNALFSLRSLEKQGILHHFPQLINEPGKSTSQKEHTIAVQKGKTIILTKTD